MRRASYVSCMQCNADLTKKGVSRKRCSGCNSVFYDGVVCQKKDWAIHKTECKELKRQFIDTVRSRYPEVDTTAKLLARPDACGIIGEHYFKGAGGFEQNYALAVFWLKEWMKGGCVNAMFMLGVAYIDGVVSHKYKEGVKLLQRASEEKDCTAIMAQQAQYKIGGCYLYGKGVGKDAQEGMKWIRLAAEGGFAKAQAQLGLMLSDKEAMTWHRKAAEQGHGRAQFNLAMSLLKNLQQSGETIRGDTVEAMEAVKWFRRSAEQGNADAQYFLGSCLMDGAGVAKDPTEAVVLYRKSADQGHADAQYQLGICYGRGFGVAEDHGEGMRWLDLAADQGHAEAKDFLRPPAAGGVACVHGHA